ncbi:MAG TPA: type II toxin-antitoxin system VapC family toxin [Azospirillaceae bacterium]|nr:type II toxin-antitoxin system VapC family toxin [Azospirillaceae bacterium]
MIAVDTSALLALLFEEPEHTLFSDVLFSQPKALISSVTVVEARMVVQARRNDRVLQLTNDLLGLPVFEIVPPGPAEVEAAIRAFSTFGKGMGHPAQLNLGDVFSYALAKVHGVPLLYKGNDFSRTDIVAVIAG